MAKKKSIQSQLDPILQEVRFHYNTWRTDNDTRRFRENGWNDVIDAYWGRLPDEWPYQSRVIDPRIKTTILEKKSRLTNSKLRGRLVPREGGDVMKARINNQLLDFQWDNANDGGSMNSKWGSMDQDARLFASAFGFVPWRHVVDEDGKCIFDGNELYPLDPNNVGIDPNCTHIRNARWCQVREWSTIEDLEDKNSTPYGELYPGLAELKAKISLEDRKGVQTYKQDRRDAEWNSRVKQLKGLEDHLGDDYSFPVYEIVTEYRPDKWITFAPKYSVILREVDNPYMHRKIPVIQLRYYPLLDDPWGESEVEAVLPLWRAIQATLCGFLDSMNLHMRPPIKVVTESVRIETIVWGPEAQWDVDDINAIQEMQSSGDALRYFQTTYSVLVNAFNTAMGDSSQGTGSQADPFEQDKTATEIKYIARQQTARDQNNQLYLAEAIQDMMSMWLSNNRQFLFMDENKHEYVLRIVGSDMFNYFKRAGLHENTIDDESMMMIADLVMQHDGNLNDDDIVQMMGAAETPRFPVFENPEEKNPAKLRIKAKMSINDMNDSAELYMVPDDLEGLYDYIPDMKTMSASANDELLRAQQNALSLMTGNSQVLQLLQQEGVTLNVKELITDILNNSGLADAERYFEQQQAVDPRVQQGASPAQALPQPGLPGLPASVAQSPDSQQMGGPADMSSPSGGELFGAVPTGQSACDSRSRDYRYAFRKRRADQKDCSKVRTEEY